MNAFILEEYRLCNHMHEKYSQVEKERVREVVFMMSRMWYVKMRKRESNSLQ